MSDSAARTALAGAARELAKADTLAFGGVGFAGRVLPATEAFQTLLDAAGTEPEQVRTQLAWLLANGSPAAKAYAATVLERIDPSAGRAAWESLVDDRSALTTFTGCVMNRVTLGEHAAGHLRAAG
jgi:hypothetical protein